MALARFMDDTEQQMVNKPIVQIAEYDGGLDADALIRALHLLSFDFPVIRARVTAVDGKLLLSVPPMGEVRAVLRSGGIGELREELRRPWDPAAGVAQLVVLDGDRHGYVALRMDHSVITGPSWTAIFARLWALYTDLVEGRDITVSASRSSTLPLPPSEVFRAVLGDRATKAEQYTEAGVGALQYLLRMDEEQTQGFLRAAREAGTTVHALTCGVVLRSLMDRSGSDEPARMRCFTVANMQLRSPQGGDATRTTTPLVWHQADVTVGPGADPVTVGQGVKDQLDQALRARDLDHVDASSPVDTCIEQRLAKVMVTNIGVVPRFDRPDGLEIVDWFRLYDVTSPFPWYAGYTYDGRYHLISVYPDTTFTQDEVEQIGAGMARSLGGFALRN